MCWAPWNQFLRWRFACRCVGSALGNNICVWGGVGGRGAKEADAIGASANSSSGAEVSLKIGPFLLPYQSVLSCERPLGKAEGRSCELSVGSQRAWQLGARVLGPESSMQAVHDTATTGSQIDLRSFSLPSSLFHRIRAQVFQLRTLGMHPQKPPLRPQVRY